MAMVLASILASDVNRPRAVHKWVITRGPAVVTNHAVAFAVNDMFAARALALRQLHGQRSCLL
jgi:hypothetical protein